MADTFSTLLGLRYQQVGGNDNTWGDLLNTDVFAVLENAIAGRALHSSTGGTLDLSAAPLVAQTHVFTGTLLSDLTVIVPALDKRMLVLNVTGGAFAMLMKTSGGTPVAIPQGTFKDLLTNSGGVLRTDAPEVGEIKYFGGTTVPSGHLACDGSAVLRASYPDLFAAIGTTHGPGNGATTFNLPDLKTAGRFIRSSTASVAVGTLQAADIAAHNHTASASTTITSITVASDGSHSHTINVSEPQHSHNVNTTTAGGTILAVPNEGGGGGTVHNVLNLSNGGAAPLLAALTTIGITASSVATGAHSHPGTTGTATTTVTVNNSSGVETRPVNISLLAVIRY